ncbi:heavy-metal-associated domain-containing protein [Pseudoduganella sp. UC29_106]|uniref:heavy-metal-associated domain-containing protein n=1 Tax=Pseudoduganella sp. UC29_106 TaxID=3374553 RepID=UPI0037570873
MYELQVENMSCGHCVATVTRAVKAVDAGATVDIDLAGKKVRVDSGAALDAVKSAIVEAGYPVTSAH